MALTAGRSLGAAMVVAAYVPLHRLLDPLQAGPAGEATRASAESAWGSGLYGTLLTLGVALVLSLILPSVTVVPAVTTAGNVLARPSRSIFAVILGLLSASLSLCIAVFLYHALPTSVDEMAQLLHAQALSTGRLAIPIPGPEAAWSIQNGLVTSEGWASIYPPFHTLLLALGVGFGSPWCVGPVAIGVATWASTLSFEELMGVRVGRVAALVLAVSPFWLLLGATYLSHTTAAACIALVLWTGLRARAGGIGWALASGAAMGGAVTARPWIGLVSSATLLIATWWHERDRRAARIGGAIAGGLPFAGLLFWWNARLFGGPLRLGYSAAYGPPHALGLHVDPWGNDYGVTEAVAYTGADLVQLGAHLLEMPLPAVALVGAALLTGMRENRTRAFLAWVATAAAANALYWHHGVHMGPRMLYETAPAWVALFVTAAAFFTGETLGRPWAQRLASWALATAGVGAVILIPSILGSAARSEQTLAVAALPDPSAGDRALVFVHGSWSSRVVARLSAAGMRRDSVETVLRRNDICTADRYARWRAANPAGRASRPPVVDLEALPGSPPHLIRSRLSTGNEVWTEPDALRDGLCAREARADAQGVVELEPLLWQAPPLPGRALIVARDMGPEVNAQVRASLGDRSVFVYTPVGDGAVPLLMDYDEGMELLWSELRGPPADPS